MSKDEEYLHFEEEYFSKDRKSSRKARKLALNKDRSQFKKTDQDQRKKQQRETFEANDSLLTGRVLFISPEGICVDCEEKHFLCTLKGSLKKTYKRVKNVIAVGDIVSFETNGTHSGSIAKIAPRTSVLSRADTLAQTKEQLIAVNIDQVIITCSVVAPSLKSALVDRYILAARKGNMEPIIVINKIDLFSSAVWDAQILEQEKAFLDAFIAIYRSLDLCVIPLSTLTGEGIEELKQAIAGKTSVFSGQSGVGKSRLISLVTGLDLPVGDIVKKTLKGSHTTTTAHLLRLEKNSFCIDTPGIKSFGLWDLKREEIQEYFSEIFQESSHCKFLDCQHINEPSCAVQAAVEKGEISRLRFDSYCALMACLEAEQGRR
ncbi:MAG TPA: ribosome small subunit-dependent GTPase A [Rhabdochlamydiaceae bacterium]|jgi:ribosome biogenesis GTPase